ncbi:hypothetical protein [Haloferula sargassicola]|uniref:Uncharacterized protein n=1 Tax=Haloferula sargassicola TaxID=490096 RepID=A0ABP9UK18_9BACT
MNARTYAFIATLAAVSPAAAQWKTETYTLKGGWNAIWLHGDATHATPAQLFAAYPNVLEVWRWNPNPDAVGFTGSPTDPTSTSSEWTIWNRDDPEEQMLTSMLGQSAYLVRCSGDAATMTTVAIAQKPKPPEATWLISGANLIGFPAGTATPPLMASYFASFPAAITSPAKIFKYIGGELGAGNPLQVSASSERLDRNTAYWFEAATVGDFTAPVEFEMPGNQGIAFGRTGNVITLGVMNRTTSAITLQFTPEASEPAPAGQPDIAGSVPLTRQVVDESGTPGDVPVQGGFSLSIPASSRIHVELGVDRSQLGSSPDDLFASFLRVTDSAGLSNVLLPVSAQVTSPAGLWVGQADVSSVTSTVAGSPGSTTSRAFPLRFNVHVDGGGTARLLSQVFVGTLDGEGALDGICIRESALLASEKADALRFVSSQMPLDRVISGDGSFAVGSTLSYTVTIPFNDPTNPFVHTYHPDHDNRDARSAPLPSGVESYDITRHLSFTFTSSPPNGANIRGWGTTVYGGTYSESIEGLNKAPLTVGGTFMFRRVSENADILLD